MSLFKAPQWVNSFYAKFPLVTLEQQGTLDWKHVKTLGSVQSPYTLWIPPVECDSFPHQRSWASTVPACLRAQLLFLLRSIPIQIRPWVNEDAAPGGELPALHILSENRLIPGNEIRAWLDNTHPLSGAAAKFHGLPNQEMYDAALALAQLVLVRLFPAYVASTPHSTKRLPLLLSEPPALIAGLTTPLPAALTGDDRVIDQEEMIAGGVEALDALQAKLGNSWALGADAPTPLDALIASHVYCIYSLPSSSTLRLHLEESSELERYVAKVMDFASRGLSP